MAVRIIYPALENYQRMWQNYRVDKHLKDDWLVRLNNLELFNVINVCEGHFTCEDQHPLIVLLGKSHVVDKLVNLLANKESLSQTFDGIITADTQYKFSYTNGISNDAEGWPIYMVKLSLVRNLPRESLIFDQITSEWFDVSVRALEKIDALFFNMIKADCVNGR